MLLKHTWRSGYYASLYKFNLQSSVNYPGHFMNYGHYTASIKFCGKYFQMIDMLLLYVLVKKLCHDWHWQTDIADLTGRGIFVG